MSNDQPNQTSPLAAVLPQASSDARLVRFACRVMLVANLLLAGFFAFAIVPMIRETRDLCSAWAKASPGVSEAILNIPAAAYWANLGGLAAALVLLEILGGSRKVKLVSNIAAMVLLVDALMIVTAAILLPLVWTSSQVVN